MVDVVGIGTSFMDQLVNVPRVPQGNSGVRADEVFHQGGGNVATAIVAAARLGARAGMIGRVGGDSTGDFLIRDFTYNGVDASNIIRGEAGTSSPYSIAISERELGTRMFIVKRGTTPPLRPEDVDLDYIAGAKILHLETGDPASLAAAEFARKKGITVTVDAGGFTEERVKLIPYVDVLIASDMFYNGMFKKDKNAPKKEGEALDAEYRENIEKLRAMGPKVVWVTRGAAGCVGLVEGEHIQVPTFDVPVKDTTGAGDVFHGAYIAAMLEGLPHRECARYANAVSSIKCMFVGGRTGIPNRETLGRFLKDGTVDTAEIEERLAYYRRSFPSFTA
ncbi:MAG: carbohydrate kinase family protein [Treponema sp.]|jgi:sugar/nucleoside kinase (ribokinase family)|nr:carbohydrate kinase family protein [Treponema sp.]